MNSRNHRIDIRIVLVALLSLSIIPSCEDNSQEWCELRGIVFNHAGINDCNWIIESGNQWYEATNLTQWNYVPFDGDCVKFSYNIVPTGQLSVCLNADQIELLCLEKI